MAAGPAFPYANNLKFDETLSLSDENYREKLENGTEEEQRSKKQRMDSVIEYPEPLVFARFAFDAYQDWKKEGESQSDYEKRLKLPEGWKLLTSARGLALKGAIYGYFGTAYWQPKHRRVVIAHRGTIPTNLNAVWADVVGIVGHSYVKQMSAASTFALKIRDAVKTVERERQTSFEIFFTGHSLGAWLAQVTTFSLKYLTLIEGAFVKNILHDGYHARTVVFDSPGCEDTIRKMIKDLDVGYAGKSTSAASLDVTSYLSSPNFVNCCNRHIGKLYRIYPQIDSEGYVKYTLSSHSMKGVLETFILRAKPKLKEVVDWPQIEIDLWQYEMWKLPDKILGKEYEDFFKFATDLNDYDPSTEEIEMDFKCTATNIEKKTRFVRVRYQTKPAQTNECASNVFTDSELEFLQRFQQLKIIPNSLFEGEEMSEEYLSKIAEKLNKLIINSEDKTIRCQDPKLKIFHIIPYVKMLLRLYPRLKERARLALTDFEVRKQIYSDITKTYLRKIKYLTTVLNQSDWPEFGHFLSNESSICHVLAEYGTDSAMAKVLKVIENKEMDFTVLAFELQNLILIETFFHLTEFLKSDSLRDVLLLIAIECKAGSFKNGENFQLVKKVQEEINVKSNVKLVIIRDTEDEFNPDDDWVRVSHDGITWDELTNQAQTEIMSKKVITFQGNPEKVSMKDFKTNLTDFPEILDPETLTKFLKREEVFFGQKLPVFENFYIPRKFKYNPYVKEEIFDKARDDDEVTVLANDQHSFSTISPKLEDHLKNRRFQIIASDEDFKFLCESNSGKKPKNIHCLKLESNLLVWRKTKGSLKLIRKHIRDSGPETILENLEDVASKTLIISDAPGMGKSTVLAALAQKMKERTLNRWVIRINLNDCAKALYEAKNRNIQSSNQSNAAEFLSGQILPCSENTNLISDFERKLFEKSLTSSGGIVLILDAFDEISPDYEDTILRLLKLLNESHLEKLVLSTRPHTKEQLEDLLGTLSYTMVPFSRDDQKMFLKLFWKKRLNDMDGVQIDLDDIADQFVDQLMESISAEEGDFLGIPLQCELLAEYTFDKIRIGEKQTEMKKISLIELYETFVRRKMDIYQRDKNSKTEGEIGARMGKELIGNEILKAHRQYALRLLLSEEKWDELDYPELEDNQELIDTAVRKAGLMLKTGDNPQFVHRTFAEFFVFDYILYLARNKTKRASLKLSILSREVLLQPEFGVVRTFFDGLIRDEKNIKETTIFLKSFVQIMAKNWTDNKKLCISRLGNTVLHVLLWGKNSFVLDALLKRLTDACGPETVKNVIDTPEARSVVPLHIAIVNSHTEIVRLLLEKGANSNVPMNESMTPLYIASLDGHLEIARLLLEKGANINACMNDDATPLFVASQNGHLEIARLLLEKGANINACINDDTTPLYIASHNGYLEIASLLLEKGANINACRNTGSTPLLVASQNGHTKIASLLLEKGANINACKNNGATPLYVASHYGHTEIARLLLEKGTNINAYTDDGATSLYITSHNGHLEIARLLIEKGANINAGTDEDATPLYVASQNDHQEIARLLIENGANINACTDEGATPLYVAAHNGHLEIACHLLEKGANIDAPMNDDATPLYVASLNGHLEIARLLIEKGANIDAPMNDGWTPLFVASLNGHLEIVRLLLENGANINAQEDVGWTSLHVASREGKLEIVKLLIGRGAKVDLRDYDGTTALDVACYHGQLGVAELLVQNGHGVNASNVFGRAPLHSAAGQGQTDLVVFLIENGAKIDEVTINDPPVGHEETPLHHAALNGQTDTVRLLVQRGANVLARNSQDQTPLDLAIIHSHTDVIELLS